MNKLNINLDSIGLVCTSIDNMAGGLERQIIRTCQSFLDQGFQVFLFTFDNENATPFYKLPEKIIWVRCGQGLNPHSSAPIYLRLGQIHYMRKVIIKNSIKKIITFHHGLFPRTLLACLFLPIKLLISERNSLTFYKYIKLSKYNIGFLSLFFADAITVQLPAYKSQYPLILQKRIFVINNFIKKPLKKYKEPNLESNKVAMLGRLCAQKNYEPILDHLSFHSQSNIELMIAGDGDFSDFIKNKYKKIIKKKKVSLLGNIKNIDKFLASASIYCLTSQWEGYPNSLAEALRMCLPIVISKRFIELKEFVEHEINGLIVNDNEYIDAIVYLLENKNLLAKMSKESYKKYFNLCMSKPSLDWYDLIENK